MDSLPAELLAHVFSFLPPEDVARGKQLNKHTLNSLTLYRRRLPRPDAGIVRISVEKTDNEDDVSVKINVNYRFADPMNLIESFHCKRSELLVSKKSPALYSHFKELEDCGDYVRQEVGSLAESLDIALQWITREMFLGELQIDCCEEGSLTPELMDVLVKVGRKVSEEQPYAKLSLYLNEDLLPTHVDFLNHFQDWKVCVNAAGYSIAVLSKVTVPLFYLEGWQLRSMFCPVEYMTMILKRLNGGDDIIEYGFAPGIMDSLREVLQRLNLPLNDNREYLINCAGRTYAVYVDKEVFFVANSDRLGSLRDTISRRSQLYLSRSQ